jgi:hypothetical protein
MCGPFDRLIDTICLSPTEFQFGGGGATCEVVLLGS